MTMPKIDLDQLAYILSEREMELVRGIVATRGKNKGCLRAAKPKVAKMVRKGGGYFGYHYDFNNEEDAKTGKIAYLWRMVAFSVSTNSQHHCMPCTADFSLPGSDMKERRLIAKELDKLVDKVIKTIPLEQHYGTIRWGSALGYF